MDKDDKVRQPLEDCCHQKPFGMSKPKTQLQQLIEQYIELYYRYSGNSDSLDKQAFKKMLEEQFPDTDESPLKQQKRDQLFVEADINKDGKLSFAEVGRLISKFIAETNDKVRK
ncbi:protein S100-A10-like isoform X2 [Podarcis raffonei]|uniref:protein S100-A10-like isoform X2 n=1 Tax=Podarcis raffonei TaxID=65483 RepID=UPI0023295A4A|nr:protein S100-A10-like isoform X2 [Podarcis raffonei]